MGSRIESETNRGDLLGCSGETQKECGGGVRRERKMGSPETKRTYRIVHTDRIAMIGITVA